jgi:hypothetical protein
MLCVDFKYATTAKAELAHCALDGCFVLVSELPSHPNMQGDLKRRFWAALGPSSVEPFELDAPPN